MSLYVNFLWEVRYMLLKHAYACCTLNVMFYIVTVFRSYIRYVFEFYIYLCYLHNIFI
jgi:hypothetical protein